MNQTESTAQAELAAEIATGLRSLAVLVETNPELAVHMKYGLGDIHVLAGDRDRMAAIVRAAKALGAKIRKVPGDKYFSAICAFGVVKLDVFASREEVCERIVVGTETVTKQVPDPALLAEVPLVEVTETVEQVRWECRPLLADDSAESREPVTTGSAVTS